MSDPKRSDARLDEVEDRLTTLEARLRAAETENDALRARLEELGTRPVPLPPTEASVVPANSGPADAVGPGVSRRSLLTGAAGAAAVGAVGVVATAAPAAANSQGQSFTLGDPNNTATNTTGLSGSFTDRAVVGVWNQGSASAVLATLNAVTLPSMTAAVVGQSDGYNGLGGQSKDSTGVVGQSTNGYGVSGVGATAGVHGSSGSTGVSGEGSSVGVSGSGGPFGVTGLGSNTGVKGTSTAGFGVTGDGGTGTGVSGTGGITGVAGTSDSGTGVYGTSTTGSGTTGVSGHTGVTGLGDQIGVSGQTNNGTAVWGQSTGGIGLKGVSTSAAGLSATSQTGPGALLTSDAVQLSLQLTTASRPAPTTDAVAHQVGELLRDGTGALWYCTAAGTPGVWQQVGGPGTTGAFHVLPTPARVYDSRPGTFPSQGPKTPLTANTARTLDLTVNNSNVPPGATAALVTILLVNAYIGNGNFTIWANGASRPLANTMVWGGNAQRFTTTAVTALDPTAKAQVQASATTDLVLDVVGYYR